MESRNLVDRNYHKLFARIAAKEAEKVLPLFEKERPKDYRPRKAIEAIRAWSNGKRTLGMKEVRKLSLDSHAAARACKTDSARFAARAAGQAVAVWHVPTHAMAVPMYACKAKTAADKEKIDKVSQIKYTLRISNSLLGKLHNNKKHRR